MIKDYWMCLDWNQMKKGFSDEKHSRNKKEAVMNWIVSSQNLYVEILSPNTLECTPYLETGHKVKPSSSGCTLIQCLHKKVEFKDRHRQRENAKWRWRPRSGWYFYKPKNSKECQKLGERHELDCLSQLSEGIKFTNTFISDI